jgi:hypothetical protein
MRRCLLGLSLLLLSACSRAPKYNVYVTGYTGGAPSSIPAGSRIAVIENPKATNPLLEQEIVAKVRRALAAQGFRSAPPSEADYAVLLRYGADSHLEHGEESTYVPGQTSTVKDSTGKVIGTVTGDASTVTVPTTYTRNVQWFTMTAVDGRLFRQSQPGKPIWIGETKSSDTNLDLRSVVDFLIVPTASAFGHNQPQTRSRIRGDDATVLALRTP